MKTEDLIAWGDEHPALTFLAQMGIYALCWLGFFAGLAAVAFLLAFIGGVL